MAKPESVICSLKPLLDTGEPPTVGERQDRGREPAAEAAV